MLTIGLVGRAQGGKSTAGIAIMKEAQNKGLKGEIFEIGGYVLKEAIDLNRIPSKERSQLTDLEIKQLVTLGMEKRDENPFYWINTMFADISAKKPDVAVINGVRFLNEAAGIRSVYNGKIVRVKAYLVDGIEFISSDRSPNHISEIEHHSIMADYFLTTLRGEPKLLAMQAATLFNYLYGKQLQ